MAFMGMSEDLLPVFLPIIVYWLGAAVYQVTMTTKEHHRLFTKEEEQSQNLATPRQVVVGVLLNQTMQMILVACMFKSGVLAPVAGSEQSTSLLRASGQMAVAALVIDGWDYFWHRLTHENKFLYKHVHAIHHHLVVPYSYGSQYNHPADAFVGEILGGLLSTLVSGMSPRTAAIFFSVLQIKGLDDHCGMWFPNHPIHRWFANNAGFHTVHHQHAGTKYNYSMHLLATWDLLLGTYIPFTVEPRKEGGYQLQVTALDKDQ